jgi:hypothetical protein
MLKKYADSVRIQWSGKAWEIRHALRQETRRAGKEVKLAELLMRPSSSSLPPIGPRLAE